MKQRHLQLLGAQGVASSGTIQSQLNVSQATVSRLVKALDDAIVICGKGKSTQYALAKAIGSAPASQPIWLINEAGLAESAPCLWHQRITRL